MPLKSALDLASGKAWRLITVLLGDSPDALGARESLARTREVANLLQQKLEQGRTDLEQAQLDAAAIEKELKQTRNERLEWMAKESTTRKDLQDAKERNKELLEQVVRLTHLQRQARQSLLDQKFKSEATPFERNRFEAEMSAARARVKEAEERVRRAEEKAAQIAPLQKEVQRMRNVESRLAWENRQSRVHLDALRATLTKVRQLEEQIARLKPAPKRKPAPGLRTYRKPRIRQSRRAVIEA
ncbi:MAG TPA: hypothetical protein VM425_00040 [Myxococcota bacterium]|nr:hypothetical protein [Myxococcota bacterium]